MTSATLAPPVGAPERKCLGVSVTADGAKGSWFMTGLDQPSYGTWDFTGLEELGLELAWALPRGERIATTVLQRLHTAVPVAIGVPHAPRDGRGWDLQCALHGTLYGVFRGRGLRVLPIDRKAARGLFRIAEKGRAPLIEWAAPILGREFQKLPKWKQETVADSLLLARAAQIQSRGVVG